MASNLTAERASVTTPTGKVISIAILAMGGEGGGVLADWLVDVAENAGYYAQTTSVPGVAQRTGATIYYVEMFPEAEAQLAGKEPVLGLMPVPGEVDVVVASELMEAGRAIQRGLVSPDRTLLIASEHRVYSMSERTAVADERVDTEKLLEAGNAAAKRFVRGDFARIAEEKGSVISASLFGALAATGALPFERRQFEEAVRRGGVGVESSLAAFAAGYASVNEPRADQNKTNTDQTSVAIGPRLRELATRIKRDFPTVSHIVLLAAVQRLADYQDEAYAAKYLDLLEGVRDADAQFGDGNFALITETGRYLALWMTYEDAARVADLKIRRTRFERVRQEVKADPNQLIEINEFLHPSIDEITDILPARFSRFLLDTKPLRRLIERFTGKGRVVKTSSLTGFLLLYGLAGMRRWRRGSLRFEGEHKAIHQWLQMIPSLAAEDYALALEVAECPRLIKGYGETHANGMRNFNVIVGAISRFSGRQDAAEIIRKLREVALADESGKKLDRALQEISA